MCHAFNLHYLDGVRVRKERSRERREGRPKSERRSSLLAVSKVNGAVQWSTPQSHPGGISNALS